METNESQRFSPVLITGSVMLVPTLMLLIGYVLFPWPLRPIDYPVVYTPLFLGLILLGIGTLLKPVRYGHIVKIIGWGSFAFYWALMPNFLYFSEDSDVFNAAVCIIGIYVLCYFAYHEWLSLQRKEHVSCLQWIAGGTALAGLIYFIIEKTVVADWLIQLVTQQSGWLFNIVVGGGVEAIERSIFYNGTFVVNIIFACTAVQAMVLFVGMILPLPRVPALRKLASILLTVIPIYILNLGRNALISLLVKNDPDLFFIAHNVIGKIGALLVLIGLLYIMFKILPELFDEIMCIVDLPKRNGPVEQWFSALIGKKKT